MSQFYMVLFLAFFLKLLSIGLGARLILQKYADLLGSLLGGWLLTQCFFMAWMFFLSTFSGLSTLGIWVGLCLLPLVFIAVTSKKQTISIRFSEYKQFLNPCGIAALLGAFAIFMVLTYRSLYFYDNTWDALTYGLTRIAFYAHYHSILMVQPTQSINIFCNEWNGELNALFYLLATTKEQAVSFGNVEIWLVGFFGFSWFCGLLKTPVNWRFLLGLLLSGIPALLALSMTVKGDLLAVVALTISLGYTYRALADERVNPWNFAFAFAALGLASGAKVVVLPYVAMAVFLLLCNGLFIKKIKVSALVGSALLFGIGNLRYLLNFFDYGDFFKRIETSEFSWAYSLENIKGLITVGGFFPKLYVDYGALGYGFGFLAIPLLCLALVAFLIKWYWAGEGVKKTRSLTFLILFSLLGINFCFLLLTLPWYPWSFRYFAPILLPGMALLMAWSLLSMQIPLFHSRWLRTFGFTLSVLLVVGNACAVFLSMGENYPVHFRVAMNQTELERKVAHHAFLWTDLSKIKFTERHQINILLWNTVNSLTLPFFGEKHQNHVEFVDTLETLQEKARKTQYDMVILSSAFPNGPLDIKVPGYQLKSATYFWMIFTPEKFKKRYSKANIFR